MESRLQAAKKDILAPAPADAKGKR